MGEGVIVGEVRRDPRLVFGGDAGVGGADGGGTVGAVVGEADMRTGQQVTTSVMISVPSWWKTTRAFGVVGTVTSVRNRPTMRPMEA